MLIRNSLFFVVILIMTETPFASEVFIRNGDVFYKKDDVTTQLTSNGMVTEAVLSPSGKNIAYIQVNNTKPIAQRSEYNYIYESQVMLITEGSKSHTKLAEAGQSCDKNEFIGDFKSIDFLSGNKRLVLLSSWAAVHGAILLVEVITTNCSLVLGGNSLSVVKSGEYKDHLIVQLHKYFMASGSFDWYWLIDLTGKEIGPVGDDAESVNRFKEMYED